MVDAPQRMTFVGRESLQVPAREVVAGDDIYVGLPRGGDFYRVLRSGPEERVSSSLPGPVADLIVWPMTVLELPRGEAPRELALVRSPYEPCEVARMVPDAERLEAVMQAISASSGRNADGARQFLDRLLREGYVVVRPPASLLGALTAVDVDDLVQRVMGTLGFAEGLAAQVRVPATEWAPGCSCLRYPGEPPDQVNPDCPVHGIEARTDALVERLAAGRIEPVLRRFLARRP